MLVVKKIEVSVEKEIAVRYFLCMGLFTTLKHKDASLTLRTKPQTAKKAQKTGMSKPTIVMIHNMKRRAVLQLRRVFQRKRWLSFQCYSLALLVNLYLAVLDAQNEQIRQKRLQKFVVNGTTILKNYDKSVYKQFRKALGKKRVKEPPISSIEKAAGIVYEELKAMNKLHQRKLKWKQIIGSARSLIRDAA
jgi:hypothetical protein